MDADDVVRLRRAIQRLARQLNASATDEGLTPSQASVLALILGHGPLSPSELARLEGLDPTMLSRMVGKLDDAGLIRRTPDPRDLRSAAISITPAGRRKHERIKKQRSAVVARCVAQLPDADQDAPHRGAASTRAAGRPACRWSVRLPSRGRQTNHYSTKRSARSGTLGVIVVPGRHPGHQPAPGRPGPDPRRPRRLSEVALLRRAALQLRDFLAGDQERADAERRGVRGLRRRRRSPTG